MPMQSFTFEKPSIPYRPHQCPNCKNLDSEKRCSAYTQVVPLFGTSTMTLPAKFNGESHDNCPKFIKK